MRPIIPGGDAARSLPLLERRRVPSFNAATYERNFNALQAPTTASREARAMEIKRIFDEFHAKGGQNALPDTAPVPSLVRQQVLARLHSRIYAQNWAVNFADAHEVGFGERPAYRVSGVKLPPVYKLDEPGGNWVQIHRNRDGYYMLDDPSIYTIPEIWIPRFNPLFADRYLDDLIFVSDTAGIAMGEQMEADAVTAVGLQAVASGMRANAWDWISSRVPSGNVPDTNILDLSGSDDGNGKVNFLVYKKMALHAMKIGRTFSGIYMDADTIGTMWDAVTSGSSFPTWPEAVRETMLRGGQNAYMQVFNTAFPMPTPTNSLDNTGSDKFFWALLEPSPEEIVPRGAFWWYTWPPPDSLGDSGEAYVVDNLEYLRTQVQSGRIYDVFLVQKNALMASVAYQQPNLLKVQYAT